MTNVDLIENHISLVKKYLAILDHYQDIPLNKILDSIDLTGAMERYLYLVAQSTIDLAETIINVRKYRKPTTLAESFLILAENNIIDNKLADKLVGMTKFRNVLAHVYMDIDYNKVYNILINGLGDIKDFIKAVEKEI